MEDPTTNSSVYMSEREVQNVISSFRIGLSMYTSDIEKLQAANENLHIELQGELTKSNALQEELKTLQLSAQEKTSVIDSCQDKISLIESALSELSRTPKMTTLEIKKRIEGSIEAGDREAQRETFNYLVESIKKLEAENGKMKKKTDELQSDLDRMNSEESVCKVCLHCKREFIPKQNKEGDCVYHSGKLKYYSCKGCGDDPYYNCCNKCSRCSEGCRKGKHILIV